MSDATHIPAAGRPRVRRLALQILAGAALFLAFESAARGLGWLDPTEGRDPYLGFAGTNPLYRPERQQNGEILWRTSPNKRAAYRTESFSAASEGVRIFCLGGSSVRSDALPREGTFPGLLEAGLRAAVPGTNVEVVNAGGGGTGSFHYREVAREVRGLGADLIVVYPEAGERNYLPPNPEGELAARDEEHPWRASARRQFARSRLYALVRDGLDALRPAPDAGARRSSAFSQAALDVVSREFSPATFSRIFDFKKDRVPPVMPAAVPRDRIEAAHRRFVANLVEIAREAREAGVPVLFVDTVRNLKADFYLRFHVEPRELRPGSEEAWRRAYEEALAHRRAKRYAEAIEAFRAARACYADDRDEILGFHLGECLEALGRPEEARAEYERAFLRHPLKRKLAEAAERAGAPLVDPYPALVAASPAGIPGTTMFTDAFHPQVKTNEVIAGEILRAMSRGAARGVALDGPALARGLAAIADAGSRVEIDPSRRLQLLVYRGDFAEAVALARKRPLRELTYVELMYLGYAQGKLGMGDAARQTLQALREQVLGSGAASPRRIESDADVVRQVFDGDLFSEF